MGNIKFKVLEKPTDEHTIQMKLQIEGEKQDVINALRSYLEIEDG